MYMYIYIFRYIGVYCIPVFVYGHDSVFLQELFLPEEHSVLFSQNTSSLAFLVKVYIIQFTK